MSVLNRITLFALIILIISLNTGVDVYRVHCDMRNKTYVSLLTAYDPCVEDIPLEENASCCKSKAHCAADSDENDDDSCCDEEQITITYEPDFFQKNQLKTFFALVLASIESGFSFSSESTFQQTASIQQFPQPPPLSGRDILTLHAVFRI
jgi:hypothetical protein